MKKVSRVFFEALGGFEIRGIGPPEVDVNVDRAGSPLGPRLLDCGIEGLGIATVMSHVEEGTSFGTSSKLDVTEDSTCTECRPGRVSEMS